MQGKLRSRNSKNTYLSPRRMVRSMETYSRASPRCPLPNSNDDSSFNRLGQTIISAYTLSFQTHLFSVLPASFANGIKSLVASTLLSTEAQPSDPRDRVMWQAFDTLSLIERYETLIASVGYEYIESHVNTTCTGTWSEHMLPKLRTWMLEKIVPWMVWPFARGATNGTCRTKPIK